MNLFTNKVVIYTIQVRTYFFKNKQIEKSREFL
jgi:hypothetical protein